MTAKQDKPLPQDRLAAVMDEAGDGRKPLNSHERLNVGKIEKAKTNGLSVEIGGSASKGHILTETRDGALPPIFGASDSKQASALLSHCQKVLHPDEAGDAGAINDERHFLLSIVRDMAPEIVAAERAMPADKFKVIGSRVKDRAA